jgi:hypothetical protein
MKDNFVSKDADGNVIIDGNLTIEGNTFGVPKNYRLIQDITLEEDTKYIELTTDKDGNPLNLKSVFIFFNGSLTKTSTKVVFQLFFNDGLAYQMWTGNNSVTENTEYGHYVKSERIIPVDNKYIWQSEYPQTMLNNFVNGQAQGLAGNNYNKRGDTAISKLKSINKIGYGRTNTDEGDLKAGSRIIIWGIDDDE